MGTVPRRSLSSDHAQGQFAYHSGVNKASNETKYWVPLQKCSSSTIVTLSTAWAYPTSSAFQVETFRWLRPPLTLQQEKTPRTLRWWTALKKSPRPFPADSLLLSRNPLPVSPGKLFRLPNRAYVTLFNHPSLSTRNSFSISSANFLLPPVHIFSWGKPRPTAETLSGILLPPASITRVAKRLLIEACSMQIWKRSQICLKSDVPLSEDLPGSLLQIERKHAPANTLQGSLWAGREEGVIHACISYISLPSTGPSELK